MKIIGKIGVLAVLVVLVSVALAPATPTFAKDKEESPPGIQENSGWTVMGDNLYTTHLDCNVGIGTTSPSGKLEVVGNIVVSGTVDGIDIDVEIGNLTNATSALQAAINAEKAARIAADNTLQTNINNLAAIDALDYDSLADLETAVANGFNIATISGNVGIGLVSPKQKLDVAGNVSASGSFIAGSTTYGDGYIGLSSGIDLNVDSGTLFIDNMNNSVGIGTLSPSKKLHVAGDVLVENDLEVEGNVEISGELDPEGGIVSSDTIIIESTSKEIKLIAGGSIITIDPEGGITIESTKDITIESDGALDLHGKTVSITSDQGMDINVGTLMDIDAGTDVYVDAGHDIELDAVYNMKIDAGVNMDINSGLKMDIKSNGLLNMRSLAITDIRGTRINLNSQFGGRPAARQNDMVSGFCPMFGGPLIGGNIALGSNTVFIG